MNKKLTFYLNKTILSLFVMTLCSLQLTFGQAYGDFPYVQSFTDEVQPAEITIPTNSDPVTFDTTGMVLTPAENSKLGAAFLNNITFSSVQGLRIEFEYGMYGGTGADGISVFLFDADEENPQIGARGEGLAYMYNRTRQSDRNKRKAGLTAAYLGIGFDAWGKFKEKSYQGDSRKNGILKQNDHINKSHVTLRGAMEANLGPNGRGLGYTGYPVLITRSTLSGDNGAATLNSNAGYDYSDGSPANFELSTPGLSLSPAGINYRKAYIELLPNPAGGYNITVKVQHSETISTIIDNYHYETSFLYTENANTAGTDFNNAGFETGDTQETLDASVPDNFRIGFGAATGGANNRHLIRNLKITIPFTAEAVNDEATMACDNAVIDVLNNDIAYTGATTPPTGSSENIDKSTFRFLDAAGAPQGYSYTDPAKGTFSYDVTTGLVTFTPISGFEGIATIQYDIKGGGANGQEAPYNDEAYRSVPATITVNVERCVCTVPGAEGDALDSSVGITTLNRNADNWLTDGNQLGANLVLESTTKPFVITRVQNVSTITSPIEGMLVWERITSRFMLYKQSGWSAIREGCNNPVLRTNQ